MVDTRDEFEATDGGREERALESTESAIFREPRTSALGDFWLTAFPKLLMELLTAFRRR